jgi:hypothetical protein
MEHNNITYTKEQVLESDELKKILFEKLKKEQLNMRKKEYSKNYRDINKEKVNMYQREKRYLKYNSDPEYKSRVLQQQRNCKNKKKILMGLIIDPLEIMKRGRPDNYKLDDNLELMKTN